MDRLPVIHDATPDRELFPAGFGRGFDPDARPPGGFAAAAVSQPAAFPAALLVPRSEWQARIAERKARKSGLYDLLRREKLPAKDQASLPYCWAYATTHCFEMARCRTGQPYVALSACSVGGPIVHYRRVGGFGNDALERIADVGAVPESAWPDHALDPRLDTPESRALAADFRAVEWVVPGADGGDMLEQVVSLLLNDVPGSGGYNWWGHQVALVDVDWVDGDIALVDRNQWQGYGDDNYFKLQGRRMVPDDACFPLVAEATV